MKIGLAQLNVHVGNFSANTQKIIAAIRSAEAQGAALVVFSELCICGYPSRDFLEFDDYIAKCREAIDEIARHTMTTAAIVGAPARNPDKEGKDLFNAAWFLWQGRVQHITHKTLLPTYDIFDEARYFEANTTFDLIEFNGRKLAVTICEDIWNVGNDNPLYTTCPMDELVKLKPDLMINLSSSPFSYIQHTERTHVIRANCLRYHLPMIYVNQVGAQTELIFDGGSVVMDAAGNVTEQLPFFEEEVRVVEVEDDRPQTTDHKRHAARHGDTASPLSFGEGPGVRKSDSVISFGEGPEVRGLIHDALILGIRDYFAKLGFKKAILGLSGGIDSALVLCLAAEALGAENVLSVLLPSAYSSDHSVDDSLHLIRNLGSPHEVIPIEAPFQSYLNTLQPFFKDMPADVTEENLQARVRGTLLMALSNKFGYILLNTTNKSEAAVGYGTLYGDMCGGLAVLGDVYKTQVYDLASHINRHREIIPANIISKAPSAELRPGQKDSDSLPVYDLLDRLLFQYIEMRQGPKELVHMGFDAALVDRVLRMVNMNEWKRFQAPPILRVSPKAFGMGRRMPIEGKYLG